MRLAAVLLDEEHLFTDARSLQRLASQFDSFIYYPSTAPEQRIDRLKNATVAITNGTPLPAAILAHCPDLRLILVGGTGAEYVDLEVARKQGIAVYNCQEYAVNSLAQHTFALILGLSNNLLNWQRALATDAWQAAGTFCLLSESITELTGKTLVIVGYGATGKRVKVIAESFGMQVKLAELPARQVREGRCSLDELLPDADVVSIHCPLTEETRHLFSAQRLALMKRSAILINIARGAIIDEEALATALSEGVIAGAGIDVFSDEPLPRTSPLLADHLQKKLVLTPHVAWASDSARKKMIDQLIENVAAFRQGITKRKIN